MYFYELHEGDGDVFADLLVAHEEEFEPEEFLRLVLTIREHVIGGFHHDTLIEAIAEEMERDHGFIFISDDRLTAAVNVSRDPDENFLTDLEGGEGDGPDEDDEDTEDLPDFKAVLVDFDPDAPNRRARPH